MKHERTRTMIKDRLEAGGIIFKTWPMLFMAMGVLINPFFLPERAGNARHLSRTSRVRV
jgi:hypothetical protein